MRNHDWCHDIPRDEAVRAAEDGRTGPLPTLEAVIAQPFAEAAKRSPTVSKTSETQSGLRTERVTLEVTHSVPVGLWDWTNILETYRPGESVRVVEEFGDALPRVVEDMAAEIKRLDSERDAAIQQHSRECVKCSALADKVIGLKARVASLESQLESVACRAATAENRVAELESTAKAAADANADGESNHAAPAASGAAEPVAWMCEFTDYISFYESKTQAERSVQGDVVPQPLYRTPPQAASVAAGTDVAEIARLAFDAGWGSSRDGFNAECAFDHLAPKGSTFEGEGGEPYEKLKRDSVAKIMSEAASVAANSPETPMSSEPVAWGVIEYHGGPIIHATPDRDEATQYAGETVDLFAAPQPASGWLTAEERESLEWFSRLDGQQCSDYCQYCAGVAKSLLARASPPEAVLPPVFTRSALGDSLVKLELVKEALAAAGVKVKEVG